LLDGGLELSLLSLLGSDKQQIEHAEYENHREEEPESTRAALEQEYVHSQLIYSWHRL